MGFAGRYLRVQKRKGKGRSRSSEADSEPKQPRSLASNFVHKVLRRPSHEHAAGKWPFYFLGPTHEYSGLMCAIILWTMFYGDGEVQPFLHEPFNANNRGDDEHH